MVRHSAASRRSPDAGTSLQPHIQEFPKPLIEACGLPEIGPQIREMGVHIDPDLEAPFALSKTTIHIRPDVTKELHPAAAILREAIELFTLGGHSAAWPHRILAHATAGVYAATTLRTAQVDDSDWPTILMPGIGERVLQHDAGEAVTIAEDIARFLSARDDLDECPRTDLTAAARALVAAAPTEVMFTLGGDHRQEVDWTTGLNSYGISPRPTLWTAQYGSCTASSPSERAFTAAQQLRHEFALAALEDRLPEAARATSEAIRALIPPIIGLTVEDEGDVILTPSGTDAEIVAVALAIDDQPGITTIVVAPTEIGSGSINAALGRHFSPSVPLGHITDPGVPIEGLVDREIKLETIEVRDSAGHLRASTEVDREIDALLDRTEGPVLLHVVEGSKTGIRLPTKDAIRRWEATYGDRLTVLVDAAQMRVDQATVANHFRRGRAVFLTGSKFFGGPPFSGALLIPPSMTQRANQSMMPRGLADYVSKYDLPERLSTLFEVANAQPNLALLLRWEAAMSEIRSFHNSSPEIRDEILRDLVAGIREIIDSSEHVRLVESPYTDIPEADSRGLDDLPTIFTFLVLGADGSPLDVPSAKKLQRMLSSDLSSELDGSRDGTSRRLARQSFGLGQPVGIAQEHGHDAGGLRLAIGAPTLYQIIFDHTRGTTWTARIERELNDIQSAFDKMRLIVDMMTDRL